MLATGRPLYCRYDIATVKAACRAQRAAPYRAREHAGRAGASYLMQRTALRV